MRPLLPLSLVEQTMDHLRQGFRSGHWRGTLPGVRVLARDLNVSKDTMEMALHRLEVEGSIKSGGPGRSREVVLPRDENSNTRVLRVGILLPTPLEENNPNAQQVMLGLIRSIEHAGHICFFARKSMRELGDKVPRIARMVEATKADAWVVHGAPRNVLEWFSANPTPAFLIGGVSDGLGLASSHTDLSNALFAAVSELTTLGHRLIVVISPETWRIPQPSKSAQAFMDAMEKCGHNPTSFNLPAFDDTPEGLERLLHSIFLITPPTALLFVEPESYVAALGFLGSRGLRIPQDISVLSMTSTPIFKMMPKRPAHFKWPVEQHVQRIVRWVAAVANGAEDHDQIRIPATFDLGETIGPAVRAARPRSSGSHR